MSVPDPEGRCARERGWGHAAPECAGLPHLGSRRVRVLGSPPGPRPPAPGRPGFAGPQASWNCWKRWNGQK